MAAAVIGQKDLYLLSQEVTLATTAHQDHQMDLYLSLYLSLLHEITLAMANLDTQMDLYLSLLQEINTGESQSGPPDGSLSVSLSISFIQEITLATANQEKINLFFSILREILATIMSPTAHISLCIPYNFKVYVLALLF